MSFATATVRYAGMTRFVVRRALAPEVSLLWPDLLQRRSRHLASSTEESAAGTSSSLPQGSVFNIGARATA
jgi:hypothetical protein